MTRPGVVLAARILAELKELECLVSRIDHGWKKAATSNDDYYLDSVALNLHGFYSGLERVFEKIASSLDGTVPAAANWHQELLNQMATEIPGIRPAVLSSETREMLDEYRGFRHVVRNVYTYHLNPDKMKRLIDRLAAVLAGIDSDLKAFAAFLRVVE